MKTPKFPKDQTVYYIGEVTKKITTGIIDVIHPSNELYRVKYNASWLRENQLYETKEEAEKAKLLKEIEVLNRELTKLKEAASKISTLENEIKQKYQELNTYPQ